MNRIQYDHEGSCWIQIFKQKPSRFRLGTDDLQNLLFPFFQPAKVRVSSWGLAGKGHVNLPKAPLKHALCVANRPNVAVQARRILEESKPVKNIP